VIALLITGLVGSLHCVGMCGGFALAVDRPGRPSWRRVASQAVFHAGKGCTYLVLGGLAGLAGAALVQAPGFRAAQAALGILAGALMVLAGLQLLGVLKDLPLGPLFGPRSPYQRAVRATMNLRGNLAPFVLGALTGVIPCPLVYAFLAHAVSTGSVLEAMGTMAILALASAPALALVAATGAVCAPHRRVAFVRFAGALVVVLGAVTLLRGLAPGLLHAHAAS
jgi:sulfite exporter TauE/SafE